MIILGVILVVLLYALLHRGRREIQTGQLIFHQEFKSDRVTSIVEKVRFQNAVECIKQYNNLVSKLSSSTGSYQLDEWTHHQFTLQNGSVEIFRYGDHIKLIKTIQH